MRQKFLFLWSEDDASQVLRIEKRGKQWVNPILTASLTRVMLWWWVPAKKREPSALW
jgi:hypothetical protein